MEGEGDTLLVRETSSFFRGKVATRKRSHLKGDEYLVGGVHLAGIVPLCKGKRIRKGKPAFRRGKERAPEESSDRPGGEEGASTAKKILFPSHGSLSTRQKFLAERNWIQFRRKKKHIFP